MHKRALIQLAISIVLLSILSCDNAISQKNDQSSKNSSDLKISNMLKAFYNAYIILQSDIKPPKVQEEKVDSLLKRYCTSVFLNFYGTINGPDELDWDPFLDAQFCSIDWLKSLTIKKDLKRNDLYYVSFIKDSSNNELTTIELSVIKEKDIYKIDSLPQLTRHIKFVRSKN